MPEAEERFNAPLNERYNENFVHAGVGDSLNSRLSKIESAITRIELAITGSPQMGHKGIVDRLNTVEQKVEKHDRKLITWGAFVTAFAVILQFILSAFKLSD